jgi:hypothetical protein
MDFSIPIFTGFKREAQRLAEHQQRRGEPLVIVDNGVLIEGALEQGVKQDGLIRGEAASLDGVVGVQMKTVAVVLEYHGRAPAAG